MLTLIFLIVLLCSFPSASFANSKPYSPTELILLNCGEQSTATSGDGRTWVGDVDSKFSSSNSKYSSFPSLASDQDPSVSKVPFTAARILQGKFTYNFLVSPGPKFLRLYFNSNGYAGLAMNSSFFSVTANNYTLLHNFSAYLVSIADPPQAFIVKEFVITVSNNGMLNVTFTPWPNSFGFVNGLEVVSMPNNLYTGHTNGSILFVGTDKVFDLGNTTALETAYRFNVGGVDVSSVEDTGMFRTWQHDKEYLLGQASAFSVILQANDKIRCTQVTPDYTAPEVVYKSYRSMGVSAFFNLRYNLTWLCPVDSGFYYLVRLHFCEDGQVVRKVNGRVFSVFINNRTAETDMDVVAVGGGTDTPLYRDYVVYVPQEYIRVELHPYTDSYPQYSDAILNGFEIFKLNKSYGNLAAPNPEPLVTPAQKQPTKSRKSLSRTKIILGTTVLGSFLSFLLLLYFTFRQRKHLWCKTESSNIKEVSPLSKRIRCRHFSLADILTATKNFNDALIIGRGGFGNVYRGHIVGLQCDVAIKRLNSKSHQGENEFWTEIEMLSQLRYINLVSLIGYCNDNTEMILVYDYMSNGTLRDHLYKDGKTPLQWKQRLKICIGAARGLDYLHSGAVKRIIHRDVKSTNILLDEEWVAKVSDFGLSKTGPIFMANVPITTMVKGTFGYMDPEYYRRLHLTEKSDVYSFGVVLFEVLCARPAVDINLDDDQIGLAGWARKCVENETIGQIIDPYLQGKIAAECLKVFAETATKCIHEVGVQRPTMSDVARKLEFALQLQETAEARQLSNQFQTIVEKEV